MVRSFLSVYTAISAGMSSCAAGQGLRLFLFFQKMFAVRLGESAW
jgi:hypothetical protein